MHIFGAADRSAIFSKREDASLTFLQLISSGGRRGERKSLSRNITRYEREKEIIRRTRFEWEEGEVELQSKPAFLSPPSPQFARYSKGIVCQTGSMETTLRRTDTFHSVNWQGRTAPAKYSD